MRRSRLAIRPLSLAIAFSLSFSASAAITSATIIASTLSPTCLEYKVVGICYWLLCTPFGCKVKTSTKVRHYVPDAVVSAYSNTGMNPWIEMSPLGTPNPMAQAGNDGTTNHVAENNIIKFKGSRCHRPSRWCGVESVCQRLGLCMQRRNLTACALLSEHP